MKKLIVLLFICSSCAGIAQNEETNEAKKLYNSGAELYGKSDYIGAIKDFSKALQYRAKIKDQYLLCEIYINRSLCRMILGSQDAYADANEAVRIKPEYSRTYFVRSMVRLHIQHDADNAILDIDSALRAKPDEVEFLMQKMVCLETKKMYAAELDIANKIISDDPKNMLIIKHRGAIYSSMKNFDSAIKDFKYVLESAPNDFAALGDMANAYAQQDNWEEAKKYYLISLKADTTQAFLTYNNLAYFVGHIKNDFKASLEYCNKSIELNPHDSFAYSNKGFAELQLGDNRAAKKDVQKSIDMNPKNPYAYKNRALILIAENKIPSACLDLQKAKKLDYSILYDDEVDKLLEKYCH
jgi:tetratricopeptide (TPR) repeat protein